LDEKHENSEAEEVLLLEFDAAREDKDMEDPDLDE
jgi:hypothetical protein